MRKSSFGCLLPIVGLLAAAPALAQSNDLGPVLASIDLKSQTLQSDDFSAIGGWSVGSKGVIETSYIEGRYHIAASGQSPFIMRQKSADGFGDALVMVEVASSTASAPHPAGIFVRFQDPQNFHAFVVGDDESYASFRLQGGVFAMDGASNQRLPAGVYKKGEANRVAAVLRGMTLRYYVNDAFVEEVPALWLYGSAGILMGNSQAAPADTFYDNWLVASLPAPTQ